jgi:hypothetical protein
MPSTGKKVCCHACAGLPHEASGASAVRQVMGGRAGPQAHPTHGRLSTPTVSTHPIISIMAGSPQDYRTTIFSSVLSMNSHAGSWPAAAR